MHGETAGASRERERERSLKNKFYLNGGKERDQEKQGDGR